MSNSFDLIGKSIDGNVIIDYAINPQRDDVVFIVRTPEGGFKTLCVRSWKLDPDVVDSTPIEDVIVSNIENNASTKVELLVVMASGVPEGTVVVYNTNANLNVDVVIQDINTSVRGANFSTETRSSFLSRPAVHITHPEDAEKWSKIFNEAPMYGETHE